MGIRGEHIRVREATTPLALVADKSLELLAHVAKRRKLGVRGKDKHLGRNAALGGEVVRLLVITDVPLTGAGLSLLVYVIPMVKGLGINF